MWPHWAGFGRQISAKMSPHWAGFGQRLVECGQIWPNFVQIRSIWGRHRPLARVGLSIGEICALWCQSWLKFQAPVVYSPQPLLRATATFVERAHWRGTIVTPIPKSAPTSSLADARPVHNACASAKTHHRYQRDHLAQKVCPWPSAKMARSLRTRHAYSCERAGCTVNRLRAVQPLSLTHHELCLVVHVVLSVRGYSLDIPSKGVGSSLAGNGCARDAHTQRAPSLDTRVPLQRTRLDSHGLASQAHCLHLVLKELHEDR